MDTLDIKDLEKACLNEVLTIGEVMRQWGRARNTIIMHVLRGNIIGRQPEGPKGIWLISKQSVIHMWGEPTNKEQK